jgi:uncharacterized membrane protein YdbT with pleckstrin-like domain
MGSYIQDNLTPSEIVEYETCLHWIVYISFRGLLTLFIAPAIDKLSSDFAITNRRVIIKVGLFSRRTLEMNWDKVESIHVDQSIIGRLLGYGNIEVIGTGGTREPFMNIAAPMEFRKQYQLAVSAL